MTRDETIALWLKCEDVRSAALENGKPEEEAHSEAAAVWNGWASTILEERKLLEASGFFDIGKFDYGIDSFVSQETVGNNPTTVAWLDLSRTDFHGYTFENRAYFAGFIFPGQSIFGESKRYTKKRTLRPSVTFREGVQFKDARFLLDAVFDWAHFERSAGFNAAHFSDIARFDQCVFEGTAWFHRTIFDAEVWMGQVKFKGYTDFYGSTFNQSSSFYGIQSDGVFTLDSVTFQATPDFTQAAFQGAPRIDNASIPTMAFFPKLKAVVAKDIQARYRAIRQLAVTGNDHENEAKAFKAEMRAKRGTEHRPWHMVFWLSILYDLLSDFGRSVLRPLAIWAVSILAFAAAYLASAGKLWAFTATCPDGSSYAAKSFIFAGKNAILFVGWDREQITAAYACLYDLQYSGAGLMAPPINAFIQAAQSVWSAILIFLFLLAARNQFKIK